MECNDFINSMACRQSRRESATPGPDSHHTDPAAVRTDPGGAVAHPPFVLDETNLADLKTTGAVPAKRQYLLAAVALKLFSTPAPLGI
jgi:hypothetical protein